MTTTNTESLVLLSLGMLALFLDLEHGTQQLDVARVDNIATWAQLNATLHSLASEDTGFETLVIDTLYKR